MCMPECVHRFSIQLSKMKEEREKIAKNEMRIISKDYEKRHKPNDIKGLKISIYCCFFLYVRLFVYLHLRFNLHYGIYYKQNKRARKNERRAAKKGKSFHFVPKPNSIVIYFRMGKVIF